MTGIGGGVSQELSPILVLIRIDVLSCAVPVIVVSATHLGAMLYTMLYCTMHHGSLLKRLQYMDIEQNGYQDTIEKNG